MKIDWKINWDSYYWKQRLEIVSDYNYFQGTKRNPFWPQFIRDYLKIKDFTLE